MKKLAASIMILLFCVAFANAQSKEEKKVDSFNKIQFRVAGKFYLRQGSPQKVVVEADKDDLEELDVRVDGGRLIIENRNKNSWSWGDDDRRYTVYVTVPDISGIGVAGSGDLVAETNIKSSSLDLAVSGSGSMQLTAEVSGDMEADVSGSGNIELKGKCRAFSSAVSGSGRVRMEVDIAEVAGFRISGSGKILAKGKAQEVKATISGSGEVLAADLVVDKCDVRISGSGDVEINVNKSLDASISGSGNVSYRGNPAHVNSHSSGSGGVRKM